MDPGLRRDDDRFSDNYHKFIVIASAAKQSSKLQDADRTGLLRRLRRLAKTIIFAYFVMKIT